jgi:hypothetical protein
MYGHTRQQQKGPAQMTLPSHSFCLEDRAYFFLVVVEEPVVV